MFSYSKVINTLLFAAIATVMIGCSGESVDEGSALLTCDAPMVVNSTGDTCVEPQAIVCVAPLVPNAFNDGCEVGADPNAPMPTIFAGENEAILFYNRANRGATNEPGDPQYNGYVLHTWNNDTCNSYAAPYDVSSWGSEQVITGIDPNYGAYWVIPLIEGHSDCGNFIIHIGTDDAGKEMGGADKQMNLVQDDPTFTRMNWTISGFEDPLEFPITELGPQPLSIEGAAAHWIDTNTFVWNIDVALANEVRLHYSATAGIEADLDNQVNGTTAVLTSVEQTEAQQAEYPLTAGWAAFTIDATADEVKALVKNELVLAAYNDDGAYVATYVQAAKVLDDLYTKGEADADEAALGLIYSEGAISANLWAPTAQNVMLNIYDANKDLVSSNQMTEDNVTGIWSFAGDATLDRQFYRYDLTVYHSQNNAIETIWATDPYSVGLSTNGLYSQFVNLVDADLKPEGWDEQSVPVIVDPEDAVIYEGHVRDFSARDNSTSEVNRGKYLAFTETTSVPMMHLANLANNGLTHFQMLPVNDIASIGEDPENIVDITDTVADLCALNEDAPVCGVNSDDETLLSVFESYETFSEPTKAQELTNSMRGFDSFNWGYDPKHYNAPDGIYASDADGVARIVELRSMIKSLHDIGLRVNMDVVYNHTNSGGLWDNSVLDKVVPGYYQSLDLETGGILNSTCCSDTALEHRMMGKLMSDSLIQWADQYAIDGFRFDIMSHGSVDQMLAAREAVRVIDEDNFFYGEGWPRDGRGFVAATQFNLAGSEIATFNDRLREGVRNGAMFNPDGNLNDHDIVRLGMAGTLADYVLKSSSDTASTGSSFSPSAYALDPADVINYVSKHDNETLWDKLQFNLDIGMSSSDRVRVQNIAATIPLMSQGVPFLQMGGDLLRSKSMDRNTFDAGDWFNYVDFTMENNNWNVGLPLEQDNGSNWENISGISSNPNAITGMSDMMFASAVFNEFLSIRKDSKLFRLTTADDVIGRVGFHNIGSNQTTGVVVMSIDDGIDLVDLDPVNDAIVVMVNGTASEQSHTVLTASGFQLHGTQMGSADGSVQSSSFSEDVDAGTGTFTVPAYTTAVFVKPQGAEQGVGLSAYATSGAPDVVPYGDTTVFLRGGMNDWGEANPFEYKGNGIYETSIALVGGVAHEFKVASSDWSTVDYGAASEGADQDVTEGEDKTLFAGGSNLKITASIDATYLFRVNAIDPAAPVLNVVNEEPFPGTAVYLRGSMTDWGISTAFNYDGGRIYSVATTVTADTHFFKVASEDWSTVNLGAAAEDDTVVELGVEKALDTTDFNLEITIDTEASYVFIFDMVNLEPKVKVFSEEFFAGTPVYLRGGMNDWGIDDELVYNGNGTYSVDIALTSGVDPIFFKVASEDWATVNFGAENAESVAVTFGVAKTLFVTNENLSLDVAADGTYRFTVNGPDGSAPQLTVEEVTP